MLAWCWYYNVDTAVFWRISSRGYRPGGHGSIQLWWPRSICGSCHCNVADTMFSLLLMDGCQLERKFGAKIECAVNLWSLVHVVLPRAFANFFLYTLLQAFVWFRPGGVYGTEVHCVIARSAVLLLTHVSAHYFTCVTLCAALYIAFLLYCHSRMDLREAHCCCTVFLRLHYIFVQRCYW